MYDVIIIGGGPAGLSAALVLGRARKRVLLCDAGQRRNALAVHMHNYATRDGIEPAEFRRIGREQLVPYPTVEVRDARVERITGAKDAFQLMIDGATVEARRLIVTTGLVDQALPLPGFGALWGRTIFQCPYCHGWEVRDRRWGYLATSALSLHFPVVLLSWTPDVTVFTDGSFEVPAEVAARLQASGLRIEPAPVARLIGADQLERVELVTGASVPCEVLFAHPPQRQVELVSQLGLALDADGFVTTDAMTRETSVPGIYAAGDLTTRMQAAIFAASAGMQAAAALNHELTASLAMNR